jgi:hypothetical protein
MLRNSSIPGCTCPDRTRSATGRFGWIARFRRSITAWPPLGRSNDDIGAVVRAERDERQVSIDVRARSRAGAVVFAVCAMQGTRWYLNGHSQLAEPYLLIAAIAVIAYLGSLLLFSRRQ